MKTKKSLRSFKNAILLQKSKLVKEQDGQTLIEFIFLFVILITLSFGLIAATNRHIGTRWEGLVRIIIAPNPANWATIDLDLN